MVDINPREEKGKQIAQKREVIRVSDTLYRVRSQTVKKWYNVYKSDGVWKCTCKDHQFRHVCCKHIHAVEFSIKIREEVREKSIIITPIEASSCIYCHSNNVTKDGIRHNKYGDIQIFNCKNCEKYFTINIGSEKMKHDPKGITTAMQLYFGGESLRNVSKSLSLLGMDVTHQTVYNWIKKYIGLMQSYLEKITPQVSDTWRADEIYIKVRGNMKCLFAMMDDETRFLIAQEVADSKYLHDASKLFRKSRDVAGKKPLKLITDGLRAYGQAFMQEYRTTPYPRSVHERHISIRGDRNNNKMERLNGEIRDREKVMRGLKKPDTPIWQVISCSITTFVLIWD